MQSAIEVSTLLSKCLETLSLRFPFHLNECMNTLLYSTTSNMLVFMHTDIYMTLKTVSIMHDCVIRINSVRKNFVLEIFM